MALDTPVEKKRLGDSACAMLITLDMERTEMKSLEA